MCIFPNYNPNKPINFLKAHGAPENWVDDPGTRNVSFTKEIPDLALGLIV